MRSAEATRFGRARIGRWQVALCVSVLCAMIHPVAAQPMTRQARACLAWDKELHRLLGWSEEFSLHTSDLRQGIRAEARKLKERCVRDLSLASLNRYVMLMKMLYDDEEDEFESFD